MMENCKGSSNIRNLMYSGKQSLLPPKSPFPSISPSYTDYIPSHATRMKAVQKPRDRNIQHHRTPSESILIEEQPSWLDDLLNEPESPVQKGGHRRSSSDSFAYADAISASNIDYTYQNEHNYKNMISMPSWGSQENYRDPRLTSLYAEMNTEKQKNRQWDSSLNAVTKQSNVISARDTYPFQLSGSSCAAQEADRVSVTAGDKCDKKDLVESGIHDPKASSERRDNSHAKPLASEADAKRAKQQFAQHSRVRKLQYIAELERNVQALQAEGSEVLSELEFINQQHLILSLENKALKQRLESLSQEKLIKYLEQEVLEREIGRLRTLYQQQQQPQEQPQNHSSKHRRNSSGNLDSQFANLSLTHQDPRLFHDAVSGPLRI